MPRKKLEGPDPDWSKLYEAAAEKGGYFTLQEASAAGYSPPLLQYHVREGRLERAGRGILRLVQFPPSDQEDLIVLWLWTGRFGVFSHDTALLLHGLSDILPEQRHITVPPGWSTRRLRVPDGVILHPADLSHEEWSWVGPIPVTTTFRTIRDCIREGLPRDIIQQSLSQARTSGLITTRELKALERELPSARRPRRKARG